MEHQFGNEMDNNRGPEPAKHASEAKVMENYAALIRTVLGDTERVTIRNAYTYVYFGMVSHLF